jgi:hypothetical protein
VGPARRVLVRRRRRRLWHGRDQRSWHYPPDPRAMKSRLGTTSKIDVVLARTPGVGSRSSRVSQTMDSPVTRLCFLAPQVTAWLKRRIQFTARSTSAGAHCRLSRRERRPRARVTRDARNLKMPKVLRGARRMLQPCNIFGKLVGILLQSGRTLCIMLRSTTILVR